MYRVFIPFSRHRTKIQKLYIESSYPIPRLLPILWIPASATVGQKTSVRMSLFHESFGCKEVSPSSGIAGFQTLMVLLVFGYSSLSSICLFQFWHCIPRFLLQSSQTATLAPDFMLPHFYSPWERQTFSEILGSFVIMNRFVLGYMPSMKKINNDSGSWEST